MKFIHSKNISYNVPARSSVSAGFLSAIFSVAILFASCSLDKAPQVNQSAAVVYSSKVDNPVDTYHELDTFIKTFEIQNGAPYFHYDLDRYPISTTIMNFPMPHWVDKKAEPKLQKVRLRTAVFFQMLEKVKNKETLSQKELGLLSQYEAFFRNGTFVERLNDMVIMKMGTSREASDVNIYFDEIQKSFDDKKIVVLLDGLMIEANMLFAETYSIRINKNYDYILTQQQNMNVKNKLIASLIALFSLSIAVVSGRFFYKLFANRKLQFLLKEYNKNIERVLSNELILTAEELNKNKKYQAKILNVLKIVIALNNSLQLKNILFPKTLNHDQFEHISFIKMMLVLFYNNIEEPVICEASLQHDERSELLSFISELERVKPRKKFTLLLGMPSPGNGVPSRDYVLFLSKLAEIIAWANKNKVNVEIMVKSNCHDRIGGSDNMVIQFGRSIGQMRNISSSSTAEDLVVSYSKEHVDISSFIQSYGALSSIKEQLKSMEDVIQQKVVKLEKQINANEHKLGFLSQNDKQEEVKVVIEAIRLNNEELDKNKSLLSYLRSVSAYLAGD